MHLCAAIPNNDYYEELIKTSEQISTLAQRTDIPVIDGFVTAPDAPGIAPHPDWAEIEALAVQII